MPAAVSYPGVYIQEAPSGVRAITGVATSITAFIGRARRGPTDRPVRIQNFADFERTFGGLWEPSTLGYAVQQFFAHGGSDAVIVRIHRDARAATLSLSSFELVAASEGDWGKRLRVRVDHDTRERGAGSFNLAVKDMARGDTERHLNLSTNPADPRFVTRVLEQESKLIRVDGAVELDAPPEDAPLVARADPFGDAYSQAFNADGDDGTDIAEDEIIGEGLQDAQGGLWMLEQVDLFNLLCIPPFTREQDVTQAVWDAAATYCKGRRAILLVDSPRTWDEAQDVIDNLSGVITRTDSAAIYFPRIFAPDALKEFRQESFAPSGAIAGVIARIDAERGVWKSPAGIDALFTGVSALSLGGLPGLLTHPQIGLLNPIGVNCLRTAANTGHMVWGARTLDGADNLASQWKYLAVRRLAYFIEESLFRAMQWVVFEPNDEPLWAQIRLNVGAFMQTLFLRGAFQGKSPREAYFVRCSRETTTQADIDTGIVNVVVGFAPLKPAEFVVITIQQIGMTQP